MANSFDKQMITGKWYFTYDKSGIGETENYYSKEYNKLNWDRVDVPSFWVDNDFDGLGWYAIDFSINNSLKKSNVALVFDSVDDEADVYLNGKKIKQHAGVNVKFAIDITDLVDLKRENHLVVRIKDNGGPGGLCGNVYLRDFKDANDLLKSDYFSLKSNPIPNWLENTMIYELYVRAHSQEGSFDAVTADLPRLKALGVGCIWFMPIFPVGQIEKKGPMGCPYAIADFQKVNPEYGTMEDFQNLVYEAHKLNIKIILDIACNHSSWDNWMVKKHPEYYTKNENGEIVHPAGTDWTDVADFDYDNQHLRQYMWESLEYWVKEIKIDGYRCDVAELVPDDFWYEAYERLIKINPDVFMLAEGEHPRLHVNGFQMTYAWDVRNAIHDILKGKKSPEYIAELLQKKYYRYPQQSSHMLFTENHDKKRTPDFFGKDKDIVASVLTLSLPGVPMIYDGQEIGEVNTPSLFHKETITWNYNNKYYPFYQEYFKMRQNNDAFVNGKFSLVKNTSSGKVLSYIRKSQNQSVLIIANISDEKLKTEVQPEIKYNGIKVLMGNNAKLNTNKGIDIKLDAYEFSIISLD